MRLLVTALWYEWTTAMRPLAILLTTLVLLTGCGEAASPDSDASATRTEQTTTAVDRRPGDDLASIVEMVDGDTIVVEVAGERELVRIIGINAPERGECLAAEAGRRLQELVAGRDVELVPDRSDRDRYGRLLRYVEADGVDVGAELVEAGLALARRYPPDTARADGYDALQREAADAGAGLWAPDACGAVATDADVVISAIRFDADGDDNLNLNDEWVRITNRGDSGSDLTGWVLKDTSATHRYSFPSGFVLGAGASVTVRTGCGTDTATDLHWCNQGSAVWNNSGDTAFLLDPAGNIVSSQDG
jgi:micrococcal nuclease